MPRSKRNKVVSLTKCKKRPKEAKDKMIDEIRTLCEKSPRIYVVSLENERNAFLQEMRKKLRPGTLVCAKNKVMQLALGDSPSSECQDGIHQLAAMLNGPCGLLFTKMDPAQVQSILADFRPMDYARSGAVATKTVIMERGTESLAKLPHSIEAHLRQLGLPTQLKDGVIHLLGNHTVCKEGQELTSDQAQILKLLDSKQAEFSMTVEAHWQQGGKFTDCTTMED